MWLIGQSRALGDKGDVNLQGDGFITPGLFPEQVTW